MNVRAKITALIIIAARLCASAAGVAEEPVSAPSSFALEGPNRGGKSWRLPPVQPLPWGDVGSTASGPAGAGDQTVPASHRDSEVEALRHEMSELRQLVLDLKRPEVQAMAEHESVAIPQPAQQPPGTQQPRFETQLLAEPTRIQPRRHLLGAPQLIGEGLLGQILQINFEEAIESQLGRDRTAAAQIIPVQVTEQPSLLDTLQDVPDVGSEPGVTSPIFEPQSIESSLFSQLGRGEQRAEASAAPSASGIDVSGQSTASIDTTELTRESDSQTGIAGIRRAQVSIQPVVRGYLQQQIYGQYQGANFIPARFDLDSILSNIDPGIIDNLVIIPGPYGVKYGPGLAFIDIVPLPTPRDDVASWDARTTMLYQTNGEQFYGRESVSLGGPNYGARVAYGHKIGNDYESGHDDQIPATYNVRDLDAIVGYDVNESAHLEFEYLRQEMTDTEFAGLAFDATIRKTDAFFFRFNSEGEFNADWLVEAWYNRILFAGNNLAPSKQFFYRDNVFFNGDGVAPYPEVGFIGYTAADATNSGGRISPTWEGDNGSRLSLGADFHFVAQELDEFSLFANNDFNFSDPGEFDNFPVPQSRMIDPGLFIDAKTPLNDAVTFSAGARIDWVNTNAVSQYRAAAPNGMIPPIYNLDGTVATGGFAEVFGTNLNKSDVLLAGFMSTEILVSQEVTAKIGVGHGQRPPSLTERYAYLPFLTVVQSATNFPLGDPNLRPERATQLDATLIAEYAHARIRVSGFYSEIDDYIAFGTFFIAADPEPAVSFQNINATIAGSELSLEYFASGGWTPFGSMSYVHGQNVSKHEPLPSMYPLQSRMGLRYREPENEQFGFEVSARVVAGQYRVATSLDEPTTPGFMVYNVRGFWQAHDRLRLSAGIDNLTDKNYLEPLSIHDPAVLEPGFNFFMSAQIDH